MASKFPLFGLTFPKKVIIPNPRINLCYYVVWFLVLAFFVLRFIISQQWLKNFDIANDMFAHTWVAGGDSTAELQAGWNTFSASGFCTYPNVCDYWWDNRESSKFTNYTCKQPCYNQFYATDCVPTWDLYKSTREHTFLVTSIRSAEFTKSGTYYQNYLLSSADHLQLGLSYGFDVVTPSGFWHVLGLTKSRGSRENVEKARSRTVGTDAHAIKTEFVDADGSLSGDQIKDGIIVLSVRRLLELAGKPNLLNGTRPDVGPNQMQGSNGEGPSTRRVGVDVIITIECGDTEHDFWPTTWSSDYTCYLSARTGETPLVENEHVDNTGYEQGRPLRQRKMYGIRVVVESRGHFKIFDSNNFLLQLVALLVLLSIPKSIVLVFMTTCLGRLSVVYKRFVYEDFPLRGTVAGMITRLVSSGNTFHKLMEFESKYKHHDDGEDDVKGISDAHMKDRIREIIGPRHPNHSEEEIEQMVDFCFYMVFKSQLDHARHPSSTRIGTITLDGFTGALARNEKILLDDLLPLFDWKRNAGPLESLFTPSELRKDVLKKAIDESGYKSQEDEHPIGKGSSAAKPQRDEHGRQEQEGVSRQSSPSGADLSNEIASAHKKLDEQMSNVESNLTDVQTQLLILKEQMYNWQRKQTDNAPQEDSDSGESVDGPAMHEVNKLSAAVREMSERFSDRGSEAESVETTRLQKELQVIQAQHAIKYHCFMERLESLEHIAEKLSKRHAQSSSKEKDGSEMSPRDEESET